nr:aminotransferase class I/II-fold pyridoxal phosphate-dependent enzyme [Leucobacter japonicus]
MVNPGGPIKTPPSRGLPPLPPGGAGPADGRVSADADGPATGGLRRVAVPPSVSRRSAIPAFEVMRITEQIAQRRAAGRDVVSLCAGEPSARPVPGTLRPAGYTGPLGTAPLREAVAGHYREWYGVDVDPASVAITTGSSGAFQLAFLAAFDPGDRVALASPGYPAYRNILTALGVEVVEIPAGPEARYQPTPALLDRAVAEHGDLAGLILASPANPTGTMLDRQALTALVAWCSLRGVRLVSDEIYHGITFADPGSADARGVTARQLDAEAIVINSFSKYWGMTGWRLGWALLPDALIAPFEALASNFALSPPAPAQELALTAFTPESYAERDAIVAGFGRARQLILDAASSLDWGVAAPSDGAFYYYSELGPQLDRFTDSVTYSRELLSGADVAVVPGVDFDPIGGSRSIRLSYAAGESAVAEALERILRFQRG